MLHLHGGSLRKRGKQEQRGQEWETLCKISELSGARRCLFTVMSGNGASFVHPIVVYIWRSDTSACFKLELQEIIHGIVRTDSELDPAADERLHRERIPHWLYL